MRLLNTASLALHEFFGDNIPPYAILSHRWEGREVSFQDLQSGPQPASASLSKIERCCAQALSDGWDWAWIDTCCIDKTSSAELSEAINSMFRWYRDAQVCYAYLSDVPGGDDWQTRQQPESFFRRSEWFERGWTLQELLAPDLVVFFDADWEDIGTKNSMQELLSSITGIDSFMKFDDACIAKKMSWAAGRRTTRKEDEAYCLMGLFGVNMPPLYGEGTGAFYRLQLEILKITTDDSIFAFGDVSPGLDEDVDVLAHAPSAFSYCQQIEARVPIPGQEFAMTNKGMRMTTCLLPYTYEEPQFSSARSVSLIPLSCVEVDRQGGRSTETSLAVCLQKFYQDTYTRQAFVVRGINAKLEGEGLNNVGERTVIYIGRYSKESWRSFSTPHFILSCTSSIEQGYNPGKRFYQEEPRLPLPTLEHSQNRSPTKTAMWGAFYPQPVILHHEFTNARRRERFVLGLGRKNLFDRPGAAIVVAHPSANNEESRSLAVEEIRKSNLSERLSKLLPSGNSVSVALKPTTYSDGLQCFLVEVSIDPEGRLKWPS